MDRDQALNAFAALAHADRLGLIRLLVRQGQEGGQGQEGLAAGHIGQALGLSASRLSFHLATLEAAGLIGSRRVARNVIYSVRAPALGGLVSFLMADCCCNDPKVLACCTPRLPSQGDAGSVKT